MISANYSLLVLLLLSLSRLPMPLLAKGALVPTTTTPTTTMADHEATVATAEMIVGMIVETTAPSIKDGVVGVDPLEGGVGVAVAVVAQPPGSMSHAKYAAKRATTQKIAGPVTPMKMTMARRRSMQLTVWIQIGTRTRVPLTILLES
jgi:hypothetical protein